MRMVFVFINVSDAVLMVLRHFEPMLVDFDPVARLDTSDVHRTVSTRSCGPRDHLNAGLNSNFVLRSVFRHFHVIGPQDHLNAGLNSNLFF